jgi:hypothetical protein
MTVGDLHQYKKDKKLEVPHYQRPIKWNDKRKEEFIDSLKSGYPFGTLLVFERENGKLQLVDGLQRTETIDGYYSHTTDYFLKSSVPNDLIRCIQDLTKKGDDAIRDAIEAWYRGLNIGSLGEFDAEHGFSFYDLMVYISKEFEIELTTLQAKGDSLFRSYTGNLSRDANISKNEVPVLVFTGKIENLPEVFSRLNRGGQQLTKFEIFAAEWSPRQITISNGDIIKKIQARYQNYENEGYVTEVEVTDYNLFDYVYGLGKLLVDKYPLLFPVADPDRIDTESIGFNLIPYCMKLKVSEMRDLPDYFFGPKKETSKDLKAFEDELFDLLDNINNSLVPTLGFKLNATNKKATALEFDPPHSEFQIVSMVAKAYALKEDKKALSVFLERLPYFYLYDILDNYWSGSGDSSAYAIVTGNNSRYDEQITVDKWQSILKFWFERQDSKKDKQRSSQGKEAMLFLRYIYTNKLTFSQTAGNNEYDLDHIVPVKRLRNLIINDEGLPINHVGNIALLPQAENRGKRDKTIYEYYDNENMTEEEKANRISTLENYTFTSRSDLAFVGQINDVESDTMSLLAAKKEYLEYIKKRCEKLAHEFIANLPKSRMLR